MQMCTSGMVVTYLWSASVGAQVCFSLQPPFDQSFWQKSGKQWTLQIQMREPRTAAGCHTRKQFFFGGCQRVGERLCVNSRRFFHYFIPSENDVFEGHMFDICVLIVATWSEVRWTSEIPQKNSFHSLSFNTHQNEIPTPTPIKSK